MRGAATSFRLVALTLVLFGGGSCLAADTPWATLLGKAGLTLKSAQLDPGRWTGGGQFRLDSFQRMWDDWRTIDPTATAWARESLAMSDSFYELLACAAQRIGVRPLPLAEEVPPARVAPRYLNEHLLRAIRGLHIALGQPLKPAELRDLIARVAKVPPPVAEAAATVIDAVPETLRQRAKAFAKFGGEAQMPAAFAAALKLAQQDDVDPDVLRLMDTIDLPSLINGGLTLAAAVDRAIVEIPDPPQQEFSFAWDTPIGKIALNGTQANFYRPGPYLLILDTGGNDVYESTVPVAAVAAPIHVIIDLAGDDVYDAKSGFGPATGVCGYGFLYDADGNDTYRASGPGYGVGIFGVGMLIDARGHDMYSCGQLGEGVGVFGVGTLADLAGDDTYYCLTQSQGYAGPKGFGLLVDRSGDDVYVAEDTKIVNPSEQTREHNVSLAQGCGFGRRAHPGDGHSLAGGIGMLVDGSGNDHYKCGVFGQGVGYWYGAGLLVDMGGNDTYEGAWYVQGSAAHYAIGALCDLGGNDRYLATATQSQGQGHDYSIGLLHDVGGRTPASDNDTFECPAAALGNGRYNGIGILWKQGGRADYKTGQDALGAVGPSRPESSCLGLFMSEGVDSIFPPSGRAKPHTTWLQPADPTHPLAHGVGMDG